MPQKKERDGEERDKPWSKQNGIPIPSSHACPDCMTPDPQRRSAHQMILAHDGLDALSAHLHQYHAQQLPPEERREAVHSLCAWIANLVKLYSGFADDSTGATLPWWEAKRLVEARTHEIARSAYEQAPEAYKQAHPYAVPTRDAVPGFTKIPHAATVGIRHSHSA